MLRFPLSPLGSIVFTWCAVASWLALSPLARAASIDFRVTPAEVQLVGNFARAQLVVTQSSADGKFDAQSNDLTSQMKFASSNVAVASVTAAGELLAVADGQAIVTVSLGDKQRDVAVTVTGVVEHPPVKFSSSIRPILNKAGCAMAACHAAQHGKGGFKLSVFGFDPKQDREAMAHDWFGRRINPVDPDQSLLLLKPSMQVPHGGGRRLAPGGVDYQILRAWIAAGAPGPQTDDAEPVKLHVFPAQRRTSPGATQQLRVEAEYPDGTRRDVTALAKYASMDDGVVSVAPTGMVSVVGKGQSPVMIIFDGQVNIALFVVPFAEQIKLADWHNNNFIDEHAATKFRELGIEPSPLCDDATFLRRAYFDAIGTLPTPEETLAFLDSGEPDKRAKLIDRLLGLTGDPAQDIYNDAYAAYWSLKWSDLLRNNSASLGEQGMWAMHNWIKEAFRTNRPFDQFVRELITARGSLYSVGPANYFRINKDASSLAEATAQTFLGVRMECAKCHHHPFEKYSQDDYYGLAAFFSRVGTKRSEEFGLFGGEQVVVVNDAGEVRHPQTGKNVPPKPLDAVAEDNPLDRRIPLAAWLTSPENEFFADSVVNRYMSYLLGKGLVEPVDDLRSTNPPSNPPLMDALAQHFVHSGFNLKQLMRTIMNSRLYQLDSQPTSENAADERFFSHYSVKRLTAEPLSDAIDRVTLVQTKFKNLPLGTRAIELPDAEYPDYFLNTFAKPRRVSVCECERVPDANLAQALHTLNGDLLATKISDKQGRIAKLLAAKKPHDAIVTELYLCTLNRLPSDAEREASQAFLAESTSPAECYQDLLWALLNSKQFLFVR